MKAIVKNVEDLTTTEYKACYLANYRENGYMQPEISACRYKPKERPGIAIMIWDGPDDQITSLLGWCLLTPTRTWGLIAVSRYIKSKSKYSAQFWVKRQHRRKGLANMLMLEVKKIDPRPHVFPHCEASGNFLSGFDVSAHRDERYWMKRKPKIA